MQHVIEKLTGGEPLSTDQLIEYLDCAQGDAARALDRFVSTPEITISRYAGF